MFFLMMLVEIFQILHYYSNPLHISFNVHLKIPFQVP